MKPILVIAILLRLASPYLAFTEPPRSSYTTLVFEFVGEMDKPVFPIVISTSSEESEWYRQHIISEFFRDFARVDVVPASTLNEIAESPLLKRALETAKPTDDEPKTADNVRFTAGVGHDHAQIMLDAQTSTKILKDIARVVGKYPTLKGEIQEIANHVIVRH
jgi:hypothetical protein